MATITKQDLNSLINAIRKINSFITELKNSIKIAEKIQYPKTPSFLSENIVLFLIKDKKILVTDSLEKPKLGGKIADIIAVKDGLDVTIEVKGTTSDFQYFGAKDIHAQYLIWIELSNILRNQKYEVVVRILREPGRLFEKERKITLSAFAG